MYDAAQGELIARVDPCSNMRARAGARTLEGSSCPIRPACRAERTGPGGSRVTLWGAGGPVHVAAAAKRVRGARVKPRARLLLENPKRAKPKGASSGRRVKTRWPARDSRKGRNPETAARWAGPSLWRREHRRAKRYVGPSWRKRAGYLARGESSEG